VQYLVIFICVSNVVQPGWQISPAMNTDFV
jgi:hypothetical protein